MDYESKLIIVEKWTIETDNFGQSIAQLDLSGMPNDFFPIEETFENEIPKPIFFNGREIIEDYYGKILRYTDVDKLLRVLYKCESKEHYRRTEMAINLLKSFTTSDWNDIAVVHYGY